MPQAAAPIVGSVVGGLMSSGSRQSQTASKEPWKPAIPLLTDTLEYGGRLQDYYRQNPFNAQQRQGYENLFSDLDMYRNQIMPGMAQFASGMMGANYQRGPRNSQAEAMGMRDMRGQLPQGQSGGQNSGLSNLLQIAAGNSGIGNIGGQSFAQAMGGAPSMSYQGQSPVAADYGGRMGATSDLSSIGAGLLPMMASQPQGQARPPGTYGPIDWVQANPFTRDNVAMNKPPEQAPAKPVTDKEMEAWQRAQYENWLMDQRSGN